MSRPDDPTDHDAVDDEGPLRKERIDIQRKVSLKFKEFRGFITEFSENISTGGMFIRTTRPQPPGSIFDFELTLGEDFTLIHGLGEVVWVRETDEGFDRPAGMGVRFLSLDPDSRRLIDEIVARRLESEGGAREADEIVGWGMGESAPPESLEPAAETDTPPDEPDGLFGPLGAPAGPSAAAPARPTGSTRSTGLGPLPPYGDSAEPAGPDQPDEPRGIDHSQAPVDRSDEALSDLSSLVGDRPRGESAAEADEPHASSSVSPYARSYHTFQSHRAGSAGRSRRLSDLLSWRVLGIVLVCVVVIVVLAAGFFLLAPDTAMELLMGSSGGGEETAAPEIVEGAEVAEAPVSASAAEVPPSDGESAAIDGGADQQAPGVEGAATTPDGGGTGDQSGVPGEDGAEAERKARADRAPSGTEAPTGAPADRTPRETPRAPATGPGATTSAATAPSEPLPQEPDGAPFTRILNITWDQRADQVVVTIHLDGVVREWDYSLVRINAPPPRELVRLRGASQPFPRTTIPVAADLIERIRTGFHPRDGANEIHVVLDLASPDVEVERSEAVGDEIRLYLGRTEDPEPGDGGSPPGGGGA